MIAMVSTTEIVACRRMPWKGEEGRSRILLKK
jgi:hypothetical protein